MNKLPVQKAEEEITSWLDYRKVNEKKRGESAEAIADLVSAMCEGLLSMDSETKVLTLKLEFPVGEGKSKDATVSEIKFKSRVQARDVQVHMNGLRPGDAMGMIMAWICALTGQPRGIVQAMDTSDYNRASNIVVFFL